MPGLIDWVDILTKLGFPTSTIIMGVMWWLERRDRAQLESQQRSDREVEREDLKEIVRDSIQANQNAAHAVSMLTSLLGAPRKSRGGGID